MRSTQHTIGNNRSRIRSATGAAIAALLLVAATAGLVPTPASAATSVVLTPAGDLIINGDNDISSVTMFGNPAGQYTVRVETPNGNTAYDLPTDTFRDIRVNLRGGRDRFAMTDTSGIVVRDLNINLGHGQNLLELAYIDVKRNLRITDGRDDSRIELEDLRIDGSSTIRLGGGRNALQSQRSRWRGRFSLSTIPSGTLVAELLDETFDTSATIRGGNNPDQLAMDHETKFSSGRTLIDLKSGDDLFLARNTLFDGRLDLRLGRGDDQAILYQSRTQLAFSLRADAGDDSVETTDTAHLGTTTFNGGAGVDAVTINGSTFITPPRLIGFE